MDYTSLSEVHNSMSGDEIATNQDSILSKYITKASRLLDSLSTGINGRDAADYFTKADVVNEVLTNATVDYMGILHVYPHKYMINSVASLSYRYTMRSAYQPADLSLIDIQNEDVMFEGGLLPSERLRVQISYNGGLGKTQPDLPADFIDLATMLTVRLYKEARGNYTDAIGIAQLGTMIYTKSFSARFLETLPMYQRIAPWT